LEKQIFSKRIQEVSFKMLSRAFGIHYELQTLHAPDVTRIKTAICPAQRKGKRPFLSFARPPPPKEFFHAQAEILLF